MENIYIKLSWEFNGLLFNFEKYITKEEKYEAFTDEDFFIEENDTLKEKINNYLIKQCSYLKHFLESVEGWNFLKKLNLRIANFHNRIAKFCEALTDENIVDKQPKANELSKNNITSIQEILKIHEENKINNKYDGMIELRNVQETLSRLIQSAKQLNYYLIQQNKKASQIQEGTIMLLYVKDKLNINFEV
jgi:hypothetical protein